MMKENEVRKREVLAHYLKLVEKDCGIFFSDKSDFELINCPACACSDYSFQFDKMGFEYVTCQKCRTLYAKTRPAFDKIKQFYTHSASTVFWINEFFKPVAEVRRAKIFQPRAEYLAERFESEDACWLIGDIGAGFGIFLDELRKLWPNSEYVAIEPSAEQAKICEQLHLRVECRALEEVKGYNECFDLLTAFELLEHLHNPSRFLAAVHRLLKPGGWFFFSTLNGQGFDILLLWEKSKSIYPPCHINFFNPSSISILLSNSGFYVEELETPGKLDWDIVEGMILNEGVDAGRFWKLLAEKGTPEAKRDFQNWIRQHRFSSHMRILARKEIF